MFTGSYLRRRVRFRSLLTFRCSGVVARLDSAQRTLYRSVFLGCETIKIVDESVDLPLPLLRIGLRIRRLRLDDAIHELHERGSSPSLMRGTGMRSTVNFFHWVKPNPVVRAVF